MRIAATLLLSGFLPTHLYGQAIEVGDLGFEQGRPDAPVQVVEFSDFSCPFCKMFHESVYGTLHEGYVETGKVRWIYVTFASGQYPNSFAAGAVAECAGEQGHYATVSARLYANQDAWKDEEPDAAGDRLLGYVEDLEMDRTAFMECVTSDRVAERIHQASLLAAQVGVTGTPTYVIDGFPVTGALPAATIAQILDARLGQLGVGR